MPSVLVRCRRPFKPFFVNALAEELPRIVAKALTCENPEGHLDPEGVEVEIEILPEGIRTPFDLHIIVDANDYPERKANLRDRWEMIRSGVAIFWGGRLYSRPAAFVWVRLFPAQFGDVWPSSPRDGNKVS
ncbi:MAG TPA: hypothetical protein VIJ29_01940 [Candidatus Paceibacterota bacterium]